MNLFGGIHGTLTFTNGFRNQTNTDAKCLKRNFTAFAVHKFINVVCNMLSNGVILHGAPHLLM